MIFVKPFTRRVSISKVHPKVVTPRPPGHISGQRCLQNFQVLGVGVWAMFWLAMLDVSKNRGVYPTKWMVKIMENLIKINDLGVPLFSETPMLETSFIYLF